MSAEQLAKVRSLLFKKGYKESGMTKNWFFTEDGSDRAADLRKETPIIGILISGNIVTSGHGNLKVEDDITEVEAIMKSKTIPTSRSSVSDQKGSNPASGGISKAPELNKAETKPKDDVMKGTIPSESKLGAGDTSSVARPLQKPQDGITAADTLVQTKDDQNKPIALAGQIPMTSGNKSVGATGDTPAKKGTTTAICQSCKCTITGTIDIFQKIQDEYGVIYCQKCSEDADGKHEQKEEPPKASAKSEPKVPVKTCKSCGIELSGARALECFHKDPQKPVMICEECEDNRLVDAVLEDGLKKRHEGARHPDARIPVQTYTPQGSIIKGFVPSLKEIGKLKIGRKSNKTTASGHRLPEKIDHFEVVGLMRDEHGDFIPDPIMRTLGESPKELNIFLLYNDLTLNFPTRYNAYKGGKCLCRGDGEKATTINGDEIPCNPETCPTFKEKGCKINGILSCVLADSPTLGGVYKLRTGSFYSVRSILSSLMYISTLTGGILSMIPLKLTVTPMQVTPNGQNQTVYIVNVIFPGTMQNLLEATVKVSQYQLGMRSQIQQLEATAKLALAQPESEEEQREYQDEFMPEKEARDVMDAVQKAKQADQE